jgi:outer membrane lipoprotein-sorting protein
MKKTLALISLVAAFAVANSSLAAETASKDVVAWLNNQSKVETWSADFIQTRSFKTLAKPLKESGHVWFEVPGRFRWELGHPVKTVAVRTANELLLLYPKLKRVEKFPLSETAGPWKQAMSMLEAGFPRSQQDLESQFNILSQKASGSQCELVLQPKSSSARKMMPQITIVFSTDNAALLATELEFADGSTMRNDFSNPVLNEKADQTMFSPQIPADYKVVEPMKNAK